MAEITQVDDDTKRVCWGRGDSAARGFVIKDAAGVVVNITGFSFRLTVNEQENPDPGVELFSVVGVIINGPLGLVAFAPTSVQTDVTPGEYYYDVEQTDGGGLIDTKIKAICEIVQDIGK